MTTKTRYFVIASLLTLTVGLGTGLVAYYAGFPTSAFTRQNGPDELKFVPANAALVAYADVREIMTSELRQKIRLAFPHAGGRPAGIRSPDRHQHRDRHRPGHCFRGAWPGTGTRQRPRPRARPVRQVKIEALMRERGARVEDYKGVRLVVADASQSRPTSLAFLESGLVGVGSSMLVRGAVDLKAGGASIATNDEMMHLISELEAGNAWAAGRFDILTARANLPSDVTQQLPAIKLFSVSAQVDSGIRGVARAEARDEESANNLRDVMRGFLALAKMRTSSRPEFQSALDALQLGGAGTTVSLSFELPAAALDAIAALRGLERPVAAPIQ